MLSNDGDMPAADFEAIFAHIKQQNCVFLAVPPMDRDREMCIRDRQHTVWTGQKSHFPRRLHCFA